MIVFLITSVLFFANAIRREADAVLEGAPEMIVQKVIAGRHDLIPTSYAEKVKSIILKIIVSCPFLKIAVLINQSIAPLWFPPTSVKSADANLCPITCRVLIAFTICLKRKRNASAVLH